MSTPKIWCPSCGAEYGVGSRYCSDCRVELITEPVGGATDVDDEEEAGDATDLVEIARRVDREVALTDVVPVLSVLSVDRSVEATAVDFDAQTVMSKVICDQQLVGRVFQRPRMFGKQIAVES